MIPTSSIEDLELIDVNQPSKTYKINTDKNIIHGYVDGLESIRQAVNLILSSERYAYPIFSWNYGVELDDLVGKDRDFVLPEIKRRLREAIIQDDRVIDVDNFSFIQLDADELLIQFDVTTDYGSYRTETVVNI